MYSDPALIRKHVVKLSLSDREAALLEGLCAYTGEQKATLLRELVMAKAVEVLHGGLNFGGQAHAMPRPLSAHSTVN